MRALSGNTRKATAVTLAAALVIAVYLNWQYARSDVPAELESTAAVAAQVEDIPVQADAILDELPTEAEAVSSANKNYGEAQLVSVASDSGAKFFEQARLKRQKAHDEAMDSMGQPGGSRPPACRGKIGWKSRGFLCISGGCSE